MCQGLMLLLYIFTILCGLSFLAQFLGSAAASHVSPPLGFCLGFFTLVRKLQPDQMSFESTPFPTHKSTFGVTPREFPWMLKQVVLTKHIFCNQQSVFYTAPHLKVVYNQAKIHKQTWRSTRASQMPVGLVSVDNPKFRYLQGSWFLVVQVLHLTGAGWSGLSCMLLSADGTGVGEVLFLTLSSDLFPLSYPMLELMGSK